MFDNHVHSTCSGDGHVSLRDMCAKAVEVGIHEITFTEHVDHNPADVSYGKFDIESFCAQVDAANEEYAGKLHVLRGIEFAEPELYPAELQKMHSEAGFDVILGSVHWLDNLLISVDFGGGDVEKLYDRYFAALLEAVRLGDFDVLAHLDIIKRFGVKYIGPFHVEPFRKRISDILACIIERGIALEVNTSGYRQPCAEPFPSPEILRLYRDMGGELVTIGSDAHRLEQLGFGLRDGLEAIREAGFDALAVYRKRQPNLVGLDTITGF